MDTSSVPFYKEKKMKMKKQMNVEMDSDTVELFPGLQLHLLWRDGTRKTTITGGELCEKCDTSHGGAPHHAVFAYAYGSEYYELYCEDCLDKQLRL